jgi:hypothetical protein
MPRGKVSKSSEQYNQNIDNAMCTFPCGKVTYSSKSKEMHRKICKICKICPDNDMCVRMTIPKKIMPTNKVIKKSTNALGSKLELPDRLNLLFLSCKQ